MRISTQTTKAFQAIIQGANTRKELIAAKTTYKQSYGRDCITWEQLKYLEDEAALRLAEIIKEERASARANKKH